MTATASGNYTRRRLVEMARERRVAGWHAMRKAELLEALGIKDESEETPAPRTRKRTNQKAAATARGRQPGLSRRTPSVSRFGSPLHQLVVQEGGPDCLDVWVATPSWLCVRWSLSSESRDRMCVALGPHHYQATPILRMYDVTGDDSQVREWVCDVSFSPDATEWYLQVPVPGRCYQVQLGVLDSESEFHRFLMLPRVDVPLMGSSKLGGAVGVLPLTREQSQSEPLTRIVRRRRPPAATRHRSNGDGGGEGVSGRDPYVPLHVDAEIVLHGSVGKEAAVSILGRAIPVKAGGAFEVRLPFTGSREVIPIVATTPDGRHRQTAVFAIERNLRFLSPQGPGEM